jgi:hypothetical protein
MATNLFGDFPRISYTLDDYDSEQVVVDIFKRVVLSKEFKENTAYYFEYEVLHGETPEELSYRFYGTQNLHWLILMVNDVIDPRFNWPVSEENLFKIVSDKYGEDKNVFTINRATNAKGYQVETFFILSEESTHKEPVRLLFEDNDPDSINTPIAYLESNTIVQFESNFEIEQNKNESYRMIRIMKPQFVQDVLTNFKTIITQ